MRWLKFVTDKRAVVSLCGLCVNGLCVWVVVVVRCVGGGGREMCEWLAVVVVVVRCVGGGGGEMCEWWWWVGCVWVVVVVVRCVGGGCGGEMCEWWRWWWWWDVWVVVVVVVKIVSIYNTPTQCFDHKKSNTSCQEHTTPASLLFMYEKCEPVPNGITPKILMDGTTNLWGDCHVFVNKFT